LVEPGQFSFTGGVGVVVDVEGGEVVGEGRGVEGVEPVGDMGLVE